MKSHDLARKLLSMEDHHVMFDWDGDARGGVNSRWTAPIDEIRVWIIDEKKFGSIIVIDAE